MKKYTLDELRTLYFKWEWYNALQSIIPDGEYLTFREYIENYEILNLSTQV